MGNYGGTFNQNARPDTALGGIPLGMVIAWAAPTGTAVPSGFMICDGTPLVQYNNPALYSIIAQTHGNGSQNGNGVASNLFPAWVYSTLYPIGSLVSYFSGTYIAVGANIGYTPGTGGAWAATNGFNLPDLRGRFHRGLDNASTPVGPAGRDLGTRSPMLTGGSALSVGSVELDAIQGHGHYIWGTQDVGHNSYAYGNSSWGGGGTNYGNMVRDIVSDGTNGAPRIGTETRPYNQTTTFIIRVV